MNIACVVVSVDCGDYLAHTLPLNKSLFNDMVVLTAKHDEETQRVCQHFNVRCHVTDAFYKNGDKFNKGRAINEGLEVLDFKEWVIHKDADMALPPLTRHILETTPLNEQCLYGVDRLMVPSYEQWMRFVSSPYPQHDQGFIHATPFPIGVRLMKPERGGWVPLGYFQMFHRESAYLGTPFYPTEYDSAASSDLYFAYKWPRTHRLLLPEIFAYHLATDDIAVMGQNWGGRKTARFEPRDPFLAQLASRPKPKPEPK